MPPLIPLLAEVAREAREDRGVSREEVAVAAKRSADSVRYFERGEGAATIDLMVEAYAQAVGVDPLEIWKRALKRATQLADSERSDLNAAEDEAASLDSGPDPSDGRRRRGAAPTKSRGPRRQDR